MRRTVLLVCAWALVGAAFSQVSSQDSLLARQYMQQKGLSAAHMKGMARTYQQRDTASRASQAADTADTAAAARHRNDTLRQVSTYENIVRNKTVDPDSLLRTLTIFGLDAFAGPGSPPLLRQTTPPLLPTISWAAATKLWSSCGADQ